MSKIKMRDLIFVLIFALCVLPGSKAYSSQCPQWPDPSTRILAQAELKDCDCSQLELLRNEIYARHGRKFKRKDLREYFESQPWYKYDPKNPEGKKGLNSFEQRNITILADFEKRQGCKAEAVSDGCPEWPDQASRYLTEADLQSCDCRELELLRNEIYARHGRIFKRASLQKYFESKKWYSPDINNPDGKKGMNSFEQKNAVFILNFEKTTGCKSED